MNNKTKIISFISQKGGVGKSTLAQALAVELNKLGLSVLLADCDPQQHTSYDWSLLRKKNGFYPYVESKVFFTITDCLNIVGRHQYDVLVIDGPARVSQGTLIAAQHSDLLIQPTGASTFDLVPALREYNALKRAGIFNEKLCFVANHISNESEFNLIKDSCTAANYFCFSEYLPERSSFKQLSNEGKVITENNFSSLKEKSLNLINSICKKINLCQKK